MVPLRRVPVSKINGRLGLDHGTVIRSILSVKLNLQMFYKEEVLNTQAVDFSFKANVSADKAPTAATRAEQAQSSADSAM